MQRTPTLLLAGVVLGLLPGCRACDRGCVYPRSEPPAAGAPAPAPTHPGPRRSAAALEEGFRASRAEKAFLPMLSNEAAHEAMPTLFKGREMPNLLLVSGRQPRTSEALMAMAKAMRTEGTLDPTLLNDVFWAVSSENECFY